MTVRTNESKAKNVKKERLNESGRKSARIAERKSQTVGREVQHTLDSEMSSSESESEGEARVSSAQASAAQAGSVQAAPPTWMHALETAGEEETPSEVETAIRGDENSEPGQLFTEADRGRGEEMEIEVELSQAEPGEAEAPPQEPGEEGSLEDGSADEFGAER